MVDHWLCITLTKIDPTFPLRESVVSCPIGQLETATLHNPCKPFSRDSAIDRWISFPAWSFKWSVVACSYLPTWHRALQDFNRVGPYPRISPGGWFEALCLIANLTIIFGNLALYDYIFEHSLDLPRRIYSRAIIVFTDPSKHLVRS